MWLTFRGLLLRRESLWRSSQMPHALHRLRSSYGSRSPMRHAGASAGNVKHLIVLPFPPHFIHKLDLHRSECLMILVLSLILSHLAASQTVNSDRQGCYDYVHPMLCLHAEWVCMRNSLQMHFCSTCWERRTAGPCAVHDKVELRVGLDMCYTELHCHANHTAKHQVYMCC